MNALLKPAKDWLDAGLAFLYPNVCQICRHERALPTDGYVCATCWKKVRFLKPPFCRRCGLPFDGDIATAFECSNCKELELKFRYARSAVLAGELMLEVIHRYKYQRALWFEPFLADLLSRQAVPDLQPAQWDLIVPVPLHPAKRRERGFNQAERLSLHLGKATGIRVDSRLMRRISPTETQTRLNRRQRAENVRGAFALRKGCELGSRKRIVLVDDVLTTGATTSACAGTLRAAGALDVCVWTVARGT